LALEDQQKEIEAYRQEDGLLLSENLDYSRMPFLSVEVRERLAAVRPRSIVHQRARKFVANSLCLGGSEKPGGHNTGCNP
jgi:tRNA U34 5-carboxymethylaminomethyl modifying enzyme MnmG/GidA